MDNPEQGYYSSRRQWWVLWGQPALLSLPDVRPPVIPGEKWVYVGVESGTEPV